jgi:glycosyltransferase involved in cell wall biosynthesis
VHQAPSHVYRDRGQVLTPRRLRVLHVITDLKIGGESRVLTESVGALQDIDHTVACLARNLDPEHVNRDLYDDLVGAGAEVVDLGVRRRRPATIPRAAVRLRALIDERAPDVLHSTLVHANVLSLSVAPAGLPIAVTLVSAEPWTSRWQPQLHALLSRKADAVLVNTPAVAEAVAVAGAARARIRCLLYGVDVDRFNPDGPSADLGEGIVVLGMGRLVPQKGFEDLITAAAAMSPRPRVALLGEGPIARDLRRHADRNGVELLLLGAVNDVVPYLRRADAVAFPSWLEGVPNGLLEALAVAKPVVATPVGGVPELVRDSEHAHLVPPRDTRALTTALGRALGDAGIGRRARELMVERHDRRNHIGERRLLYESLAASASRAQPRNGLVLVIPKAGSEVAEHFAHTFRLAEHLGEVTKTAVIVERLAGTLPPGYSSIDVYVQRRADQGFLPRAWELVRLAALLRRRGFGSFFVRTSQTAAVPLILFRRLFGGRVMYWNCGEASKRRGDGLRAVFRSELPARFAFRWADTVVTGTSSLAARYSSTYGIPSDRITVLPNDIDLDWFTPADRDERLRARAEIGAGDDEPIVLSVHHFSPVRRTLDYIPAVFEAVLRDHPAVRFVLVGGGPEEAGVRRAVEEAGLEGRVRMFGAVPHDHIRGLYAAADVFVMPSYTEGFPRVLLEAMAMGVPIASTDVGGVREILPDAYHERLADRDRPLELANAIDELLRDRGTAQELAAEGLRWVQRFDAPAVARELAALARR